MPAGKHTVEVMPFSPSAVGRRDDVVGIDAVGVEQAFAHAGPALARLPFVEHVVPGAAEHRTCARVQEAETAQVEHHLGNAAGEEDPHRGMVPGAVREGVDEARDGTVDTTPVLDARAREPRRVRDRGNVDEEVRRAAEGRVHQHRVLDRLLRDDLVERTAGRDLSVHRLRRTRSDVQPDRLARRGERCVRHGQAKRLGDDLRGRGSAEKLAAAAR